MKLFVDGQVKQRKPVSLEFYYAIAYPLIHASHVVVVVLAASLLIPPLYNDYVKMYNLFLPWLGISRR